MHEPKITLPPMCAGMVDQERCIGSDPVGYKCSKDAVAKYWMGGVYWRVCKTCLESLERNDGRVTLPGYLAQAGTEGS